MPRHARPRIGIDAHILDGKFQGSRTYLLELIPRTAKLLPQVDFYLFTAAPDKLERTMALPNLKFVRMPQSNALLRLYRDIPWLLRKHEIDLVHTQYVLPWPAPCKRVVTIHDILYETHPQYFSPIFVARSKLLIRRAARNADRVFTISKFSADELHTRYGVSADRISVVPNAVDLERFKRAAPKGELLARRGLVQGEYVLSVGRIEPRKNYRTLISAHAMLGQRVPPLVIVGQRDFRCDDIVATDRVKILEDVGDNELPSLYAGAKFFAYPSFAEGFGIPPLEAAASGTPMIISTGTAVSEVIPSGCAVHLDEPGNVKELAGAVALLNDSEQLRTEVSQKAYARALWYSWDASAQLLAEGYLAVMNR